MNNNENKIKDFREIIEGVFEQIKIVNNLRDEFNSIQNKEYLYPPPIDKIEEKIKL